MLLTNALDGIERNRAKAMGKLQVRRLACWGHAGALRRSQVPRTLVPSDG